MTQERLVFKAKELRAAPAGEGEPRKIVGRPAVYNELSEDLGGFRERILTGAFKKTLDERNVKSLWNHDPNYVLGSRKAGTLAIREDEFGLYYEVTPPDTQWARDFMASIERGDVDEMSFMFEPVKDRWILGADDDGETIVRELIEVRLYEVSPVTFPAYPQTSVSLRDRFGSDSVRDVLRAKDGMTSAEIAAALKAPKEPDYSDLDARLADVEPTL